MSLINDALRKASKTDRERAHQAEIPGGMKPVAEWPKRSFSPWLVTGVVLALVFAGWLFSRWWSASEPPLAAAPEPVADMAPVPEPPPEPLVLEALPTPDTAAPTQVVTATPVPAPAPPAKPAEEAWPAELKLMGIFFSKTNPRALINGRTVGVGDDFNGIRVTKIESNQVTVEWKGRVKTLMME